MWIVVSEIIWRMQKDAVNQRHVRISTETREAQSEVIRTIVMSAYISSN